MHSLDTHARQRFRARVSSAPLARGFTFRKSLRVWYPGLNTCQKLFSPALVVSGRVKLEVVAKRFCFAL